MAGITSSDLARLFRHALFNGLAGNTDDHLKNFAMLHRAGGYRLSPAYDLIPDIAANQEHVLFSAGSGTSIRSIRRARCVDT